MIDQTNIEKHQFWFVNKSAYWGAVLLPLAWGVLFKIMLMVAPQLSSYSSEPDVTPLYYIGIFQLHAYAGFYLGAMTGWAFAHHKEKNLTASVICAVLGALPVLAILITSIAALEPTSSHSPQIFRKLMLEIAHFSLPTLWAVFLLGRAICWIHESGKSRHVTPKQVAR